VTVAVCESAVEHRPLVERITVCVHGALVQDYCVCVERRTVRVQLSARVPVVVYYCRTYDKAVRGGGGGR